MKAKRSPVHFRGGRLIRLNKVLKDSTTTASMPQFKGLPLEFTPGKKKFLPAARIKLSDVLDRYERIAGVKRAD